MYFTENSNLADLQDTIDLIEAFAQWSGGRPRWPFVPRSRIYDLFKSSETMEENNQSRFFYDFSINQIMKCFKVWRGLPWKYNRLIQFFYIEKKPQNITARKIKIQLYNFNYEHRKAILMIKNGVKKEGI